MNYLPFCGYWFYGAASDLERASFYCSWGLLEVSPTTTGGGLLMMMFIGG